MKRDDTVCLRHLAGAYRGGFFESELVQDAVVGQLEIIGEAGRNVSDDFRKAHAQVPWTEIVGMRNRLVHAQRQDRERGP